MVYIYKKIIGKITYYYLRVSEKKGKKVITKDIAYLGNDVNVLQNKLKNLPEKYKGDIRKAHKNIKKFIDSNYYLGKVGKLKHDPYFEFENLKQIEAIKLHFIQNFLKLDIQTQEDIYKNFLIDFAYNTTSMEGNTITLEQVDKLFREDLTPKEKPLRDVYDLQNTQKVFFWLLNERPRFSENLIIKIHDQLMENIDSRNGYRTRDVRVFKSRFDTSPGQYVKTDMNLLFKWYKKNKKKLHPLVLVALMHQKLEKIHPFYDGNGRTGRMVLNYLLISNMYPPLIIYKKRRSEYLKVLSLADKLGLNEITLTSLKKLVKYLSEELISSYWNNFNI